MNSKSETCSFSGAVFSGRIRFSKPAPFFLYILILLYFNFPIFAESYDSYRKDDLLLLSDGKRDLAGRGRFLSFHEGGAEKKETDVSPSHRKQGPYANLNAIYRGLTQHGGVAEEMADRSFSKTILSPEVGYGRKRERLYYQILMSPFLSYEESVNGIKTVVKGADGELLGLGGWDSAVWKLGLEAGRGYQRLDRNGFLFAGFLNYGETYFLWKPLRLSFSGITALMEESSLYTERDKKQSPRRIFGGSLRFGDGSIVKNFRIFYYTYIETRQEAFVGDFFRGPEPFRPYGKYVYYGFEFSSESFSGFRFDLDAIVVRGTPEYGPDAFRSYQTSRYTSAGFAGGRIVWDRREASYFLGGLFFSKDEELRTDRNSNGYSGIRTDLRGYGGKTSFLLSQSLLLQEGTVFAPEQGTSARPDFENKGMRLVQAGARKTWNSRWTLQGILLSSSSSLGIGWEAVAIGGYESEYSYILMSLSYAKVDPQKQEPVFFEEWRRDAEEKEYARFYLSAGAYF
ncbi:hypothetical protein EHQ12_02295 [Leptospira gomenensis]|uniref:Alginate export domain-containing protein n=1 Tax=Leptospira gomenensis TaxID=2484974 RepID=A0A5F1YA76_9LEPT|nr:hypothetical protein [Leptospira gomenensis]TGK33734.1 hypothetical protein EHQ17_10550 [Leptospira gomenensis]TGK41977.1 hypothetical protein EHQ07_15190 [Leptospira gomenensis]TGK44201.1 hypothetical protein EHQ12_02295 [Leptospira gomenensis]TGK57989.1 hypothetical protein EHQ13_14580 [Leptospira gomenensis]